MTLHERVIAIYPELTEAHDVFVSKTIEFQDDGDGAYIAKWEHPTLAQPTQAQLDAVGEE
jgi:hypothetical protein